MLKTCGSCRHAGFSLDEGYCYEHGKWVGESDSCEDWEEYVEAHQEKEIVRLTEENSKLKKEAMHHVSRLLPVCQMGAISSDERKAVHQATEWLKKTKECDEE